MLDEIRFNHPDICRLELIIRETNYRTISYYKTLDFKIEGRFDRRVDSQIGKYEADIPMVGLIPTSLEKNKRSSLTL